MRVNPILLRLKLSSGDCISVPLFGQLIPNGVKLGTMFAVEFDPDSQWLTVATTMAAKCLQAGGRLEYTIFARSPEAVKENLTALGVDVFAAIKDKHLVIDDFYTATLTGGRIDSAPEKEIVESIEGGRRARSLNAIDLSVAWLKLSKSGSYPDDVAKSWPAGALAITDSVSEAMRFNQEDPFLEYLISRVIPNDRRAKRIVFAGYARGVHTESFYKRLESAMDGVIDLRVVEHGDEVKNLLRVRSIKGQTHDTRWHEIEIKRNGEAALTSS